MLVNKFLSENYRFMSVWKSALVFGLVNENFFDNFGEKKRPTSRNTQTGKDILGGNFILGGKTGKVEEIFAQLLNKFRNFSC